MRDRTGQVWEIKSRMNGERVMVVVGSSPASHRHGVAATVHKVLHITGKKLGRVLVFTEIDVELWENQSHMLRLD